MITEQDKEKDQIKKLRDGIRLCEEAITKAEKYERLSDNTDWKQYLEDLRILAVDVHDRQILWAVSIMDEAPNSTYVKPDGTVVNSKLDWVDFIRNHKIRGDQCREWIREPERILAMAEQARKTLPVLKEKLAQLAQKADPVAAAGKNGAE